MGEKLGRVATQIISQLLNVPSADSDDARRRRLLNVLLICTALITLVGFLAAVVNLTPPWLEGIPFYWSIIGILSGAVVIYFINRYWSGQVARVLFLLLLIVSALNDDLWAMTSGRGLLALAIPIVVASFLLRSYVSFIMASLISVAVAAVRMGILLTDPNLPAILMFFLVALVSRMAAYSLERALEDLRTVNRDLDQRVVERTQELERRSIQLQTASEVARDATATLDIEKLLDDTVHLISQRFGFYHAGIFLVDERREYTILRAASSESGQRMLAQGHKLNVGREGIVGHVAATGEPLVVLDVGQEIAHYVNPDLPDTRSEIALPLISRGRVIGVLDVQSRRKSIFTQEDVATLQTMADQLANAMESARLYTEESRRRREVETLYRATQALGTTLDLHRVLESILSELQQVVPYDSASVQLLKDGKLEIIGGRGFPDLDELLGVSFDLAKGDAPHREVISRREPVMVEDASTACEEFLAFPLQVAGIRSWLGAPLLLGDRLIGMLALYKQEPGFYTPEHARLVSAFAAQAAVAIDNARLYDEVKRHVEELTALHKIDVAMISTLDLDEVLAIIYAQINEILGVATFYIALYDEEKDELHVPLSVDEGRYVAPFTTKAGDNGGLAGWIVRHRQPLWIDDMEQEEEKLPVEAIVIGRSMRSLMVLPLIVRDQVVGVISAQSPESYAFSEGDRDLFAGIAHQAAIAITNARLYDEAKRRLNEANLIQEVMLAAASTLDFDLVLERVIKALHRALGVDRLGFLLPDERKNVLVPHPSLVGFADDTFCIPIKGTLTGRVYRTGHSILVQDEARELVGYLEQSPDVRSALAVPVWVGGRIVAVLHAESARAGVFGEDELRVFTTIAGQLGVMLESARLYQEMARHTRELRLLANASGGMIGSLEPREIIDHLLTALVERFQATCTIFLMEPDGESAKLVAGWMPGGDSLAIPVGYQVRTSEHGAFKRVAEARRLVYVSDVAQSEWWALTSEWEREIAQRQDISAVLILPMLNQERLVGVVILSLRTPLPAPVDEQLDWAQTLVNQAAAALANAQFYQRLEAQATELSQAYSELQEVDHLRTQLVQNVSHELRTPLGLIKGYVELLAAGDLGELLESQRSALQIIRERTATLTRLIHNLTVLQSVPREALALAPVSVAEIVRDVLEEFERPAVEAGVMFETHLPAELPLTLGDRERLTLAFGHLVDNAVKFSPDGATVTLRVWAGDGAVYVSVADEGIGIPPESLDRIFDRFYQVDGSARRRFGGMGIGLALVWEIVEAHEGTVVVESQVGKGSTFTVQLPQMGVF